jgi:copper chaperone
MTRPILVLVLVLSLFTARSAEACGDSCGGAKSACGSEHCGCGAPQTATNAPALAPANGLPKGAVQVSIKVDGMRCGGCVTKIEQALAAIEGVVLAEVTFAQGARIVYFPSKVKVEDLKRAIDQIGFKASVI